MKKKIILGFISLISIFLLTSCINKENTVTFLDEYNHVITKINVRSGSKIELPDEISNYTKEGYEILVWYLETAEWKFNIYRVFSDIELRVELKKVKTLINFDLGPGVKIDPILCDFNERVILPIPKRDDFEFAWWELDGEKQPLSIDAPTQDITLKAAWRFDDRCWKYNNTKITEYKSNSKLVYVPEFYIFGDEKRYIKSIGGITFQMNQYIEEVIVSEGIENIESLAFLGCSNLRKITLPNSITTLVFGTFQDCVSLEEINLPETLAIINSYCFVNCTSLEKLVIPSSVMTIGIGAIIDCPNTTIYVYHKEKPDDWHDEWYSNIKKIIWEYNE